MSLVLFDSVAKEKKVFEPIDAQKVTMYVCGPTVYDDAHLGHARSSVVFDLLYRVLMHNGYRVDFAKNFTDIDDKILQKMTQTGKGLDELTSYYIRRYEDEMRSLSVLPATLQPKATDNIEAMIRMIQKLIQQSFAYIIQDDGVYFDTSKDSSYGLLSHRISDENSSQARVEKNSNKKNQKDFAVWKFAKSSEDISFEAPFGKGRPGWHIECSAMIQKHLASSKEFAIDIHGGGADLLFPHHENEAAQSRCCNNQELAKYWVHNGFVNINGEKMSKSLGNSFFLKDALSQYHGQVIRYYMLSVHYRSELNFNTIDLHASKKRLDRLYRLKKVVHGMKGSQVNLELKQDIISKLNDDLNTPKAFVSVDNYIAKTAEALEKNPKDKAKKKELVSSLEFIDTVLGIGGLDSFEYFQFGVDEKTKLRIESLIQERSDAKKVKDFEKSDALRDMLIDLGVNIMDTPEGTLWEKL